MTHFSVVVFVGEGTDIEATVSRLLAPYDENDEWFADKSRWDWWVIGGRWEGSLLGDDPETVEKVCWLCDGTGTRPDGLARFGATWVERTGGCNGCHGTGKTTELKRDATLARNALPVPSVAPGFVPAAFVTPNGEWFEQARHGWFGGTIPDENGFEGESEDGWARQWGEAKGAFAGLTAVLVDCHV